jgi:hypothetical protein
MTTEAGAEVIPLEEVVRYITERFAGVDVTQAMAATFFSLDPEKHWPNFATLVTTDEHDMDQNSNLTARDAYRLNIGVGRETFERLIASNKDYDYTATDVVIPHPVYAKQRWIAIVNPSRRSFDEIVKPLLEEAHQRVARTARRA